MRPYCLISGDRQERALIVFIPQSPVDGKNYRICLASSFSLTSNNREGKNCEHAFREQSDERTAPLSAQLFTN